MAKTKGPLLSFSASGSFADSITYRPSKGVNIVSRKNHRQHTPSNSESQLANQAVHKACHDYWQTLTDEQKVEYESAALSKRLPLYQAFMSTCLLNGGPPAPEPSESHLSLAGSESYSIAATVGTAASSYVIGNQDDFESDFGQLLSASIYAQPMTTIDAGSITRLFLRLDKPAGGTATVSFNFAIYDEDGNRLTASHELSVDLVQGWQEVEIDISSLNINATADTVIIPAIAGVIGETNLYLDTGYTQEDSLYAGWYASMPASVSFDNWGTFLAIALEITP